MNKNTYQEALDARLVVLLDAVEKGWGFRPPVTVNIESLVKVYADFNIVGFAHKGQSLLVTDKNIHRRSPKAVANAIVQEIVTHRNTCDECGTHTPSIRCRIARLSYPRFYTENQLSAALVPADDVERLVFPRKARELDRLIAAAANAVVDPAIA